MDVKELVQQLGTTFEDFKKKNDEDLAELKKGKTDAVRTETLTALQTKIDDLESKLNRPAFSQKIDEAEVDEKAIGYKKAFDSYIRKGRDYLSPDEIKILTVADDTTGGFLAPEEYVQEMIKEVIEMSPIRPLATVRTTSRKSVEVPKRTGVFAASWTGEQGTQDETDGLRFGLEEIPTHKLFARVDVTDEDLEDPVFNMDQIIRENMGEQFGVAEGQAFVDGNGVTRPQGLLTNADVGEEVSGDATLLTGDGLIDLSTGIKSAYWMNANFLMNRLSIRAVRKFKDSDGQYLWQPGLNGPTQSTLLGYNVVEVPDMPNVGAGLYPVIFGDVRKAYLIIDRTTMSILRDPFTSAGTGVNRIFGRKRLGGQVVLAEAIIKQKVSA